MIRLDVDARALAAELAAALRADPALAADLRTALGTDCTRPEHVTIAAWARSKSISVSTVRAAIRDGRLPSIRIGRAVRVPADAAIAPRATAERPAERALKILAGGPAGGRR